MSDATLNARARPAPSTLSALLELREVGLRYADGTQALQGVSLSFRQGEFSVLLGASGAGKSTLLKTINGLARPSSGSVRFGREGTRVATIHQSIDLVARSSVLDNVLCGALGQVSTLRALFGLFGTARKRRACELLYRMGFSEAHLYRRASELSGGQQQRVGIARAFMSAPRLVLADEPVASLDPRTSRDIMALLHEASREQGATVLCSLHDVRLALEFADRVIGMRGGRVAFECGPEDLSSDMTEQLYAAA